MTRRFTIEYTETYAGTFTIDMPDGATAEEACAQLTEHADEFRLGERVELTDATTHVTGIERIATPTADRR